MTAIRTSCTQSSSATSYSTTHNPLLRSDLGFQFWDSIFNSYQPRHAGQWPRLTGLTPRHVGAISNSIGLHALSICPQLRSPHSVRPPVESCIPMCCRCGFTSAGPPVRVRRGYFIMFVVYHCTWSLEQACQILSYYRTGVVRCGRERRVHQGGELTRHFMFLVGSSHLHADRVFCSSA